MPTNFLIPQTRINNLVANLQTLQSNIDAIQEDLQDLHDTITQEIGQAITDLQGLISTETTRATTAEGTKVDKVSTANRVYGTDSNGDQTTYDKNSFGQVDDVKVGTTSVVTNKIATLGTMAGETASDYATTTALNNKIQKVTTLPSTQETGVLYCIPE